jgi:uncharacterized protein YjbI with pentapeptide repeats
LRGARLVRVNLYEADLGEASLNDANVTEAIFGNNLGISKEMEVDLIRRGAIFKDSPDHSRTLTPV